jgi:hypothetical protein
MCGDILYVNSYYQYRQITAIVCTKNIKLLWLYFLSEMIVLGILWVKIKI